jgi:hypothetical protein
MADVAGINPTPFQAAPSGTRPAPPEAPRAQAPPSAGDRVTIQQGETPGFTYRAEQDGQGVQYQTWAAKSGVKYEVATKGDETRFHVEIPQNVSPAPIEISGAATAGEKPQIVAHKAGDPSQPMQVEQTPDGKYLIGLAPNRALAMFDPQTMDFGISTLPTGQMGPNGRPLMYQELEQVVHADASQTIKAHSTVSEGVQAGGFGIMPGAGQPTQQATFIQIDQAPNGQVSAKQVTQRMGAEAPQGMFGKMMSGPSRQETSLKVSRQADGSFTVSGGDLMSHVKNSLSNPFSIQGPLLTWMKARKESAVIQTFASNPALLASVGATAGPAAAMGMNMPFAPGAVPPPPGFPR